MTMAHHDFRTVQIGDKVNLEPTRPIWAGADWIGAVIADVCGFDVDTDKARIKEVLKSWLASGSLVKGEWTDAKRMKRPVIEVGEWAFEGDATP